MTSIIVVFEYALDPTTLQFSYYATLDSLGEGILSPHFITTNITYFLTDDVSFVIYILAGLLLSCDEVIVNAFSFSNK